MLKLNTESLVKKELFSAYHKESYINKYIVKMIKAVEKEEGIIKSITIDKNHKYIQLFYNIK